jgi:L-alanine-DL-glutamate epimerase-like enolase superfamily enzyme
MIQEARKLNLQVMLGCMNEASIGSAAVAHLAPLADWQDNDGTLLLAGDNAAGFTVEHAKPVLQDAPGLGVQPTVF